MPGVLVAVRDFPDTNTAPYEEFSFKVENQIRAEPLIAKPNELNTRLPYLSDSLPLIGLKIRTIASIGMSAIPVLKALYPNIS